jgi:predicted alpha/beta superfamily hydrolase
MFGAVIIVAFILAVWKLSFTDSMPDPYRMVDFPAKTFVHTDANKDLAKQKIRLIVINDFHATKLNNDRNLHVYLPPSYYENTIKKYPVLYVHDGKAVFDISDWSKESLNMHIQADVLISEEKIEEIIIVGIANSGEKRLSEYVHWDGVDQGKLVSGLGMLHEDFVLNDVKPFIDNNFRTLPDKENTALMGMSIGGLSTFNIGFRNPDVFSKLAMLSPYLGFGENKLFQLISEGPYKTKQSFKIWLDVGSKEGSFIEMAAQGTNLLLQNGYKYVDELAAYEVPDGEHSEKFWAQRVDSILLYFFGDIGKPASLKLYTDGQLSLSDNTIKHINAVVIHDSGFKMTDIMGSYTVENPEILKIENCGGAMYPLAEGLTEVTFMSSTGLTSKVNITVRK